MVAFLRLARGKESLRRLKKSFFQGPKSRAGLDIGSSGVRVVELGDKAGAMELMKFGVEPADAGDREGLISSIKKVVASTPISTKRVNISISGQEVIVRYINLPKMTEAELEGAIKFEAEKYIPFDIADVILDCQILGEVEGRMMRVLLVAAKSDLITERIKIVEEAGLEPASVDVDSFAVINSFQMNNPDQISGTIALLNIGARLTNINILTDGQPCLTRDIQLAGDDITDAISERLGIDFPAAEELKRKEGMRSEELAEIVSPVIESFLSEVRLSFDYYESQLEKGIDKICLSGGAAGLYGLAEFLNEGLRMDVNVWDPTKSLEVGPDIDREKLAGAGSGLAVCIGLALRSA